MSRIDPAALSRERDGSGHGLLLVMLGEFVWRADREDVWLGTLVQALAAVDVTENATRKALQRLGQDALLTFHRSGRQTRCALTDDAHTVFRDGAARVFGFAPVLAAWDGRWLVVAASVPEAMRNLRHLVKSRLERAGMGSPAPGLWITPHVDTPVAALLRDIDQAITPISFVGAFGPVGGEAAMAATAWKLAALADDYRDFIARFVGLAPGGDRESFAAYVIMVQAWRRFPFLDPRLPAALLPERWIGQDAVLLFRDRRAAWREPAARFWRSLVAAPQPV